MKIDNLGKLSDLETATKVGKDAVIYWLHGYLPNLNQHDLLGGFGLSCPCGECHKSRYKLFTDVCRIVGKYTFQEVLKNLLIEYPHNVSLPETVYILLCWSKGHDIQDYLKPFPVFHPLTGVNHLDTLDVQTREKTENNPVYQKAVKLMETIVSTLCALGINNEQFIDYQVHCHQMWLTNYKPQMLSAKIQQKQDTFEKRFHAAMHGAIQNFRHRFDLHTDRELLVARLLQSDVRGLIPDLVRHFPTRNSSSWCKFGKRLMAEYGLSASDKVGRI
ncbi:MAG: hypothetical protein PHI31_12710 [Desulfuromonadaceae bacterium]|nr:hypothetical protein [Desulfuromonadaceae bacterium]